MVQTFDQPSSFRCVVAYSYPWASCIQAFFLRYPNPLATHVLSVDVLDRKVEQRTKNDMPKPVLCTTRLILKQGSLPSWAPKGIIKNTQSWVLEESEVDLSAQDKDSPRTMSIWTQNLDHTTVMTVTERMRFTETPKDTICHTRGDIRSFVSLAVLRWRIEKFGFKRYIAHHATAREGLTCHPAPAANSPQGHQCRCAAPAKDTFKTAAAAPRAAAPVSRWLSTRPVPVAQKKVAPAPRKRDASAQRLTLRATAMYTNKLDAVVTALFWQKK